MASVVLHRITHTLPYTYGFWNSEKSATVLRNSLNCFNEATSIASELVLPPYHQLSIGSDADSDKLNPSHFSKPVERVI